MQHGSLFQVIDCSIELPQPESTAIAFVPLLGFTSARYLGEYGWQSTITHQHIEPTFWIRPYEMPAHFKALLEVSERLEIDMDLLQSALDAFDEIIGSFSNDSTTDDAKI